MWMRIMRLGQSPGGSLMFSLQRMLTALSPRALAQRRREREEWERLLTLDDYLLEDMGLDREQIRRCLGMQPPRDRPPYDRPW